MALKNKFNNYNPSFDKSGPDLAVIFEQGTLDTDGERDIVANLEKMGVEFVRSWSTSTSAFTEFNTSAQALAYIESIDGAMVAGLRAELKMNDNHCPIRPEGSKKSTSALYILTMHSPGPDV